MTTKSIPVTFSEVPRGEFIGKVYAHNPRTGGWFIADSYTKGETTVITHIIKKDKSVITLGTKEPRHPKKAKPAPAPEYPEEV